MSRLLAAKGVGARLLRVLNTRLWPASLRSRGEPVNVHCACQFAVVEMPARLNRALCPIADDEPLPPDHDRRPVHRGLDELYRNHKRGLLRFVARRGRRDDAEDVVHQVFARMAGSSDPSAIVAPGEYLRMAASNILRDRARALQRRAGDGHVSIDDTDVADADPVAMLEARDRLARIEEAVLRLKPLARQIFLARRLDGYTYAEIAQQTGLSVRGVEKQMNRALKLLNRHLLCDD